MKPHFICALSVFFITFGASIASAQWTEVQKFFPAPAGTQGFGNSMAKDGDRLIVGASRYDGSGPSLGNQGGAYIFELDAQGQWSEVALLVPSDGRQADLFSVSVAIQGDVVAVGSPYHMGIESQSGAVYIYERNGAGQWIEQKITPTDAAKQDYFGTRVLFSGHQLFVGASGDDQEGTDAGSVYVFEKNMAGQWVEMQKIVASTLDGIERFGSSMTTHQDQLVVGGPYRGGGKVYVFKRNAQNQWVETQLFAGLDTQPFDRFGFSVSIENQTLVVGAVEHNQPNINEAGAVYVFTQNAQGVWAQSQKIMPMVSEVGDRFGESVDLHQSTLAIASSQSTGLFGRDSGKVYLFDLNNGVWTQTLRLEPSYNHPDSYYGQSIILEADNLYIGMTLDNTMGQYAGSAHHMKFVRPNVAPRADIQTVVMDEDTMASIALTGMDPESQPLAYLLETQPQHGTVSNLDAATGTLTYTPTADFFGEDSFEFKVNDGQADSNTARVTVTVKNVDDTPVAQNAAFMTDVDVSVMGVLSGMDADGDVLQYLIQTQPSEGSITLDAAQGSFTYTPKSGFQGVEQMSFVVTDGANISVPAMLTIKVGTPNTIPVLMDDVIEMDEDTIQTLTLNGQDVDNDPLMYVVTTQPAHGQAVVMNDVLTYTPEPNFNGTDSVVVQVSDGIEPGELATMTITVKPINDVPVWVQPKTPTSVTINVNESWALIVKAEDVDADPLVYSVSGLPQGATFDDATQTLRWTPTDNATPQHILTLSVEDGTSTITQTLTLDVKPAVVEPEKPTPPKDMSLDDEGCSCGSVQKSSNDDWVLWCVFGLFMLICVRRRRI